MPTLKIISGTDRPNSQALKVSEYIKPKYEAQGNDVEIISLCDYPFKDVIGGSYDPEIESVKAFNKPILEADGLVFVIPEYNGSFPGVVKLFVDYLPFPKALYHKPIAYIGEAAGAFGALRAIEQLQLICNYRNALNFPDRVFIQRVGKNFNKDTGIDNEMAQELLEDQITKFSSFVAKMKG